MAITISTTGWKWVHGVLGVLFVLVGIYALSTPTTPSRRSPRSLACSCSSGAIFDIMVAFITKDEFELWWLQLVLGLVEILLAFWIAGDFREKAILLVIYVGIISLDARHQRDLRRVQAQGTATTAGAARLIERRAVRRV